MSMDLLQERREVANKRASEPNREHEFPAPGERALAASRQEESDMRAQRLGTAPQAVDAHFGAAKVSHDDAIEFMRPEQICQITHSPDCGAPQSSEQLAHGMEQAARTGNYQESDKQIQKAVQDAFQGGGLPAVRELETQINRNADSYSVKFNYPFSKSSGLVQDNFSVLYMNRLSLGQVNDLSAMGIQSGQLPKDSLGNPGIILGSPHEMRLYKGAPPGVKE